MKFDVIEDFPEHLRPYTDEQIPAAMQRIAAHRYFPDVAAMIFPGITPAEAIRKVLEVKTVHQFQMEWMYAFNKRVIDSTIESFTYHFSHGIGPDKGYLYISNHRDIILDTSLLQMVFVYQGLPTSMITYGDNLIVNQLADDLARSNKMFKVVRKGNKRELFKNSVLLSEFLRSCIRHGNSCWIAQRNGRTKDGLDKTAPALVKMMGMSGMRGAGEEKGAAETGDAVAAGASADAGDAVAAGASADAGDAVAGGASADAGDAVAGGGGPYDLVENYASLNIVPVAISYEYESCDFLKTKELLAAHNAPDGKTYIKDEDEDLNSMITGISQWKGKVHIHVCDPLTRKELEDCATGTRETPGEVSVVTHGDTCGERTQNGNAVHTASEQTQDGCPGHAPGEKMQNGNAVQTTSEQTQDDSPGHAPGVRMQNGNAVHTASEQTQDGCPGHAPGEKMQNGNAVQTTSEQTQDDSPGHAPGVRMQNGSPGRSGAQDLNAFAANLCALIDSKIRRGYQCFPSNYIAYDMLHGTTTYKHLYSDQDKAAFLKRLEALPQKVFGSNADEALQEALKAAQHIFLKIYANPVRKTAAHS